MGMHNNIFNDSAIKLYNEIPKKIISWITILISILIIFIFISIIKFNTYVNYLGIYKNERVIIKKSYSSINKGDNLYINGKKYKYKVIKIKDDSIILNVKLDKNLKIDNNILKINMFKGRTNLLDIIRKKIKEVFYVEKNKW